jgi:hypothetical protein
MVVDQIQFWLWRWFLLPSGSLLKIKLRKFGSKTLSSNAKLTLDEQWFPVHWIFFSKMLFLWSKGITCTNWHIILWNHGKKPSIVNITFLLHFFTPKISGPFWWILGMKYVVTDMWGNDKNEMMFFYFQPLHLVSY